MLIRVNPLLDIEEVDISCDDLLMSVYGERIPVLLIKDTGEELGWPFQLEQLSRYVS